MGLFDAFFGSNAASDAAAQQSAGYQQAAGDYQKGFDANQGTIKDTSAKALNYLDNGFSNYRGTMQPVADTGQTAFTNYANLSGANGSGAQSTAQTAMMQSPIFQAGNKYAMDSTTAQYGDGKLGSGAEARALQDNANRYGQQYTTAQLQGMAPIVNAGLDATKGIAGSYTSQGGADATNQWTTGNAFIGNQNNLTGGLASSHIGSANAQAAGTINSANAFMGGLGDFASGLGGSSGGSNPASFLAAFL